MLNVHLDHSHQPWTVYSNHLVDHIPNAGYWNIFNGFMSIVGKIPKGLWNNLAATDIKWHNLDTGRTVAFGAAPRVVLSKDVMDLVNQGSGVPQY